MTSSLGGGKEGQVFTEQDFIVGPVQADVSYRPLISGEIEPETVGRFRNRDTFGAPVTIKNSPPGLAESLSFDKPRRLNDHATDYQRLTSEDEDRIAEFWLVHAGHELHVWSLRLNDLSRRRTACEEDKRESERPHLEIFREWMKLLELEFAALERIKFFFRQYVKAVPHLSREDFLNELLTLVDREEWKQGLRDLCSEVQQGVSVH